jgi:hypothetical protein
MKGLLLLLIHLVAGLARLLWPGGVRGLAAENLLIKQLLLILSPLSHPFVERLTGTVRREFLDQTLFWNSVDLE